MDEHIGSPGWIARVNTSLAQIEMPGEDSIEPICIGIELSGEAGLDDFSLVIAQGKARLKPGIDPTCPLRLKMDGPAAREIHLGTLSIAEAISQGRIKIAGDMEFLLKSGHSLAIFSEAFRQAS